MMLRLAVTPIFVGAVILVHQVIPIWIGILTLLIGIGLLYFTWKYWNSIT
jgi:Na+/phosphate symporter